jgi:hypothetical protein
MSWTMPGNYGKTARRVAMTQKELREELKALTKEKMEIHRRQEDRRTNSRGDMDRIASVLDYLPKISSVPAPAAFVKALKKEKEKLSKNLEEQYNQSRLDNEREAQIRDAVILVQKALYKADPA